MANMGNQKAFAFAGTKEGAAKYKKQIEELEKTISNLRRRLSRYEPQKKPVEGTYKETQDAITRAQLGIDPDYWAKGCKVIRRLAEENKYLTAADFRDAMDKEPESTHDKRANGSIIRWAAGRGIIRKFNREPARHTHGNYYVVWESLIYKGGDHGNTVN